ncbi:predicted protein [Candida tropicalis MYA-3404]|uniref:Uncharacterized protein n=1 Tax=Candida tropicalis (strain ATCC MYA-3404 / T1) TaxID=294747 RepID=C5MI77_CANTT|nr:predicted protein [Candida tropicalis MYA-3404]EER30774.1 predicted protein [Candida tropicalis MYA-3404]KAG4409155.1 hypothetical protein JTP64_002461 [Candida tropicalis]MCP8716443.1 hypothetical protein [Asgard group archaeon]
MSCPHKCSNPACELRGNINIDPDVLGDKFLQLVGLKHKMDNAENFQDLLKYSNEISKLQSSMSVEERIGIYALRYFMDEMYGDSEGDDDEDDDEDFPDEEDGYEYEWAYVGGGDDEEKVEEESAFGLVQRLLLGRQ